MINIQHVRNSPNALHEMITSCEAVIHEDQMIHLQHQCNVSVIALTILLVLLIGKKLDMRGN